MMTLEDIIDMDVQNSIDLPWNKIDKSLKLKKMYEFADTYSTLHHLELSTTIDLKNMLKEKLGRKLLQKIKDVNYDRQNGIIVSIPNLIFHNNKYTLKMADNVSPLHSLAPKNKTVKKTDV